jgi:thiol-disulfide isomerase/thioredoxin
LQLIVDATAATPIRFTGPGANIARLLGELDSLRQAYDRQAGQPGRALTPQAFINRLDSLQQACQTRLAMVTNGRPAQQQLLTQRCQVQQLRYQLEYALANPTLTSISSAVTLPKLLAQVPLDTQLLTAHVYEYGLILHQLLQAGYYQSLLPGRTGVPLLEAGDGFPRVVDQQLQQAGYPQPIETFLRASNLASAIQKQGTSPLTDSLRASLRQQHTFTVYQPTIEQIYAQWQPLRRGQPAPLIRGLTPDGKLFSVSQLKGKPVYVDVWASWCIPCRQGFAQTSQLRKQLPADAVLVYVSIDRDPRAWQAFLRANPNLGGIHLNQPPGPDFDAFAQAYQLGAIPRYILIDKTGRLVNATAPPPASARLSQLIAQLP